MYTISSFSSQRYFTTISNAVHAFELLPPFIHLVDTNPSIHPLIHHPSYPHRDIFKFRPNDLEGNGGRGGLHFALCKSIVELHGGQIWMHRQSSTKGNIYSFGIPLSAATQPTVPLAEPYRAAPFGAIFSRAGVNAQSNPHNPPSPTKNPNHIHTPTGNTPTSTPRAGGGITGAVGHALGNALTNLYRTSVGTAPPGKRKVSYADDSNNHPGLAVGVDSDHTPGKGQSQGQGQGYGQGQSQGQGHGQSQGGMGKNHSHNHLLIHSIAEKGSNSHENASSSANLSTNLTFASMDVSPVIDRYVEYTQRCVEIHRHTYTRHPLNIN